MDTITLLNLLGMGMAAVAFIWFLRHSALQQQRKNDESKAAAPDASSQETAASPEDNTPRP